MQNVYKPDSNFIINTYAVDMGILKITFPLEMFYLQFHL